MDRELALKVAGAFGGGMARMGETCGAVTGALMVIGLKHGMTKSEDGEARDKTYDLVREFVARFKDRHGSIVCRELLGCDINKPEERQAAQEQGILDTLCSTFVRDAAKIIEHILRK